MTKLVQIDRKRWQEIAPSFRDYNIRQTWDYSALLAHRRDAVHEGVAIHESDRLLGLADVRIKSIPLLGGGLAFVSYGPLFRKGTDRDFETLGRILEILRSEYVDRRNLVLRIQPPLADLRDTDSLSGTFAEAGFLVSKQARPYRTVYLNLEPSLETLRSNLKRRWRRHLNQSERESLEIEETNDPDALEELVEFHNRFVANKGFRTDLDARFFSNLQKRLPEAERMVCLNARCEGEIVSSIVVSLLGNTMVYLLGGRNRKGTQTRASYRLHWRAIEIAKNRGFQWYDLGGIDPIENEGVAIFKQGFGGIDLTTPGPYEIAGGGFRRTLFSFLESAYRLRREWGNRPKSTPR